MGTLQGSIKQLEIASTNLINKNHDTVSEMKHKLAFQNLQAPTAMINYIHQERWKNNSSKTYKFL